MLKRDIIRVNILYIIIILFLLMLIGIIGYIKYIDYNLKKEIELNKKIKTDLLSKYEKTTYIEKNIEQFYNFINKAKKFGNINIYFIKKELQFLIPSNVKINKLELNEESGKITGKTTDFRTIDLLSSTLKTYSQLYENIGDVTILNSSKVNPTDVNFAISFKINKEKLIDKIYTNDMDGDGIMDYKEESVDIGGIINLKKVINDECLFTPHNFVIIGKMLEQNPLLIEFYPQYKKMSNDGYFSLQTNGCLKKGDFNILYKKN